MDFLLFTHEFPPFAGGAGIYTAGLAQGLARLGHNVTVLAPRYDQASGEVETSEPYRVVRVSLPPGRLKVLAGAFHLIRVWLSLRPCEILVTEANAKLAASLAVVLPLRIRYNLTVHGTEIGSSLGSEIDRLPSRLLRPVVRRLYLRASTIICVSNSTRKALLQALPAVGARAVVVHNGIDLDRLGTAGDAEVSELRQRLRIEGPVLLTVARLIPEKGVDTVVRALPRIIRVWPSAKYIVAGTGLDRGRLESLVRDLSLEAHVLLVGSLPHEQLFLYYAMCDVFVLISRRESFGLVYVEAGAHSKPVIGSRTGGVPEAVQDGCNGLLVEPNDPPQAAEAIRRLLRDRELAERLGQNGRRLVEERFNIEVMAKKTLHTVLGGQPEGS